MVTIGNNNKTLFRAPLMRGRNEPQPDEGEMLFIPRYVPNWSRENVHAPRTVPIGLHTVNVQPTTKV